jgi:hypothetical protein
MNSSKGSRLVIEKQGKTKTRSAQLRWTYETPGLPLSQDDILGAHRRQATLGEVLVHQDFFAPQ